MKLPNGYGSVHKLKGKRRKPWRARITDGFVYDLVEDKQIQKYKTLGYYETKQRALQALAAYNENPYDLDADKITFAECYEKWTEEYFKKITPAAIRTVKAAYKYCSSLYNIEQKHNSGLQSYITMLFHIRPIYIELHLWHHKEYNYFPILY